MIDPVQYQQVDRTSQQDIFPFAVKDRNVDTLTAKKIKTGTLQADTVITVGTTTGGYIKIDAVNSRIIINDGTVDRVIIGFLKGGF
ncbi:MAG TPA: hypothetical protein VF941_23435 [Clostridia bacterium]